LIVHAILLALRARLVPELRLARPAFALAAVVTLQLVLGAGTWIVQYGWPVWFAGMPWAQGHINTSESLPQVLITTSHVATGSLILAVALLTAVRAARVTAHSAQTSPVAPLALEAAR
jgi:cytochrome c oxidase assembly protein subunit 15